MSSAYINGGFFNGKRFDTAYWKTQQNAESFLSTLRNLSKRGWKMSPAYDLTPSEGINGEHTALVNGKGANITDDDFKAVAKRFGIKGI